MYPYLTSMLGVRLWVRETASILDFSTASDVAVSPTALLAYASVALRSVREGNYTEAKRPLPMIDKLPANIEHKLRTFIMLVQELVSILDSSRLGLDQLRDLIADGAVSSARQKIREVEGLLGDASRHLDLLYFSLDGIWAIYGIDISHQREDLDALSLILRGYEHTLAELKTLLEVVNIRAATQLDLWASPSPIWPQETLLISGRLQNGSMGLPGRLVELWINGIQVAKPILDQYGRFDRQYYVSSNSRLNRVEVYARYTPVGEDLPRLRPARSSTIIVSVNYSPVVLTLITSSNRLHVLQEFTVQGKLTDSSGRPLQGERVQLLIDSGLVGSSDTDAAGQYSMVVSFPLGTPEGSHQLYARFDPRQGIYASASSEKIAIQLYYLKPTITLVSAEVPALSGQSVRLEGRLEVDSRPFQGLVVASLGERELGRAVSETDGVFSMTLGVPFDTTGDNIVKIILVPDKPWIATSLASVVLKVLNSAMIGLGIGAITSVGVMLSGRSLELRSILEGRAARKRRRETEAVAVEKPKAQGEGVSLPAVICSLDSLRKIEEASVCVIETYWAVRRVLGEVLHDPGRLSETHREYETRVITSLADGAFPFSALTHLFEVAEYSQHTLSRLEAEEGINYAILVAEAMGAEVRP